MTSGGETEPAPQQAAAPQVFPNPATQQNASPSTDDAKTPAVNMKTSEPAGAKPSPTKTTTTAKRKSRRHRRRTS